MERFSILFCVNIDPPAAHTAELHMTNPDAPYGV
jgi:hypothetical protein